MAPARIICLLALFCTFCIQGWAGIELKRGLFFYSTEVNKDGRTGLDLTPDGELVFKDGFSLEFDIQLRRETHNFGYVFRIIGNDSLNIDFLSDLYSDEANISLVVKNQSVLKFWNSEIYTTAVPPSNTWIKVRFNLDTQNNTVSISLNGIKKESTYPLNSLNRFRVCFGNNPYNVYYVTDVAPMTIKDIRFYDEKSKLVRYWPLEKHSINCVYDECIQDKAVVLNPSWEIDSHVKWQKKKAFVCPDLHHQMAFDPKHGRIFIAKENTILAYHIKDNHTDTIIVNNGIPYNTKPDQMVYDSLRNELISYDFEFNRLARFNFSTNNWDNEDNTIIEQFFMHHGRFYLAADSLLVTFGGYGFHRYFGLLQKYIASTSEWEQLDLSPSITPRYLGSMGYLGNREFLYFGGYGNESGKQEEFPRNYYDLYRVNMDNQEVEKIWELPGITSHFTNSNSLVIDQQNNRFYTLSYPNKRYASVITLHEYSTNEPQYRIVGDSIPYFFTDTESYCDLYQSLDQSELYAIVSFEKEGNSEINIYSIAYPPLNPKEIFQTLPQHSRKWIYLLFLSIGFLALIYFLYRIGKKKKRKNNHSDTIEYEKFFRDKRPSSIHLLGDFQLIDKNGNDITSSLTPTGIQIVLLLLLFTIKNGRGILVEDIKKILWFDKDDVSARNNRNVHINKLRPILKDEGIDIIKNEGYWTIVSDKNIFCDYERVLVLIKSIQSSSVINREHIDELINIALKGKLLSRMQEEWIEPYQVEYSNQIIETLLKISKRDEVKSDLMSLFKIADVIQLHDNIDEDAIRLKCYALYHLGRINQALQCYKKFVEDYQNLLAVQYAISFEELIEKKN